MARTAQVVFPVVGTGLYRKALIEVNPRSHMEVGSPVIETGWNRENRSDSPAANGSE
jgi:hypothetical protein